MGETRKENFFLCYGGKVPGNVKCVVQIANIKRVCINECYLREQRKNEHLCFFNGNV